MLLHKGIADSKSLDSHMYGSSWPATTYIHSYRADIGRHRHRNFFTDLPNYEATYNIKFLSCGDTQRTGYSPCIYVYIIPEEALQ